MKATHKVLSTKKLEPLLVQKAKESGIEIVEREFISIKPLWTKEKVEEVFSFANPHQQRKEHVVFTSANAVKSVERFVNRGNTDHSCGWKVFCLSAKTKDELLTPCGGLIGNVVGTAENAVALAEVIIQNNVKEIVFFCGDKRRDELPTTLREAGVVVHEVVLYETVETPQATTDDVEAVLFFSPSAVQSFFSVNQLNRNTVCFAIGQTTADSLAGFTDNRIIVSPLPSQEVILSSVQLYFESPDCYD